MNIFNINLESLNLFSFILGMLFAASMFRMRAIYYVTFYFIAVAIYYYIRIEISK
jgi:hypothetical protein